MVYPDPNNEYVVYPDRNFKGFDENRTVTMERGFIVEFFGNHLTKKCAKSWALVPIMNLINPEVQAVIYGLGLLYAFLGIAVISDVFMAAIEVITSKEKEVKLANGHKVKVQFWNPTVANLTLMALGSSAPEILLALLETVQSLDEPAGELGPSTIVGSAAFNLFVITAVCVYSINTPDVKTVSAPGVFVMTSTWSILTYVWLLIVLEVWTPGVVSMAEAWLTFGAFFLFVGLAYGQDRNWFRASAKNSRHNRDSKILMVEEGESRTTQRKSQVLTKMNSNLEKMKHGLMSKSGMKAISKILKKGLFSHIEEEQTSSAIFWKVNAKRRLLGKTYMRRRTVGSITKLTPEEEAQIKLEQTTATMEFSSEEFRVVENEGSVRCAVSRIGIHHRAVAVDFKTQDGSGVAGKEYQATEGTLVFSPGEDVKFIEVLVVDDDEPEPDHTFSILLSNPRLLEASKEVEDEEEVPEGGYIVKLGERAMCIVIIIDDDDPGSIAFENKIVTVSERKSHASVKVIRSAGAKGAVSCKYKTSNGSAMAGTDYQETSGTVSFEPGQISQKIKIPLIDSDKVYDRVFNVSLYEPSEFARLEKSNIVLVKIVDDGSESEFRNRIEKKLDRQLKAFMHHTSTWREQFKSAIVPAKGVDENGDEVEFESLDYALHFLTIFWKVTAAFVPPPEYNGGWSAFFCCLIYIGCLTAVVGELASLFGCAIGLKDAVTAITFVALGTSLPDTFASRTAALEAPDADAAVGNVAGSNTVNVLLGLGLPWVLASMYYHFNGDSTGGRYCIPSGSLSYSVLIYSIFAVCCLISLAVNRRVNGGELGGPKNSKSFIAIFLVTLWLLYVILSSLKEYGHIEFGSERKVDAMGCPL
ncbi:sodium/calcium exchanger protein [Chloropicon primus]|uniref:Sodium/calcium exchanger protein n=1 Tax=Chloropicon primus TaxID=1764295 RepID=A0A5B8MZ61_9CHLO|nr:sodium/calcium exchanger protein [Chloropicon primus]|eukprot:QDZ25346.1 sodium/calcium exchanger protein [Chloropicon primus]